MLFVKFGCCVLYHGESVEKHMKFTVLWPSLVSYQCLHAYTAMYCPTIIDTSYQKLPFTPCSLRLCGSCTELNYDICYCCRSERRLLFFAKKNKHCIFCFFFAQNRIFNNMVRRFFKSGDFSVVSPVFLLSRLSVNALP